MTAVEFTEPGWQITPHARERMAHTGYTLEHVLMTAQHPMTEMADPQDLWPGSRIYSAAHGWPTCRIVADPARRVIHSVLDPAVGDYQPEPAPPPASEIFREHTVSEQAVKDITSRTRRGPGRPPKLAEAEAASKSPVIQGPQNCLFQFVEELPEQGKAAAQEHWIEGILPHLASSPGRWAQIMEFPSPTSGASRVKGLKTKYPDYEWTSRRWGQKAGQEGARSVVYARYPGDEGA